jgi:dGTP triphosphohydrolase
MDETTKNRIVEKLQEMGLSAEQAERQVDELRNSFKGIGDEAKEISKAEQEMENLKNQMLQFVGLTNLINLFKRVVQSAINTVKELDAVMTETAVVTDFTIGDMWEKLPEYAAEATKLGTSIKELYAATTLYYQQGLKTEAAMGVGIETMKMARIANMDATDATTAMTAALRGFNMEVNEMNATRVNDVYSELAAITAADTN